MRFLRKAIAVEAVKWDNTNEITGWIEHLFKEGLIREVKYVGSEPVVIQTRRGNSSIRVETT